MQILFYSSLIHIAHISTNPIKVIPVTIYTYIVAGTRFKQEYFFWSESNGQGLTLYHSYGSYLGISSF